MLVLTLLGGVNAAWGQEVTYDFTGSDWSVTDGVLTNGTVSISGEGTGSFKMNTGYFMMGKSGAYITLPAYDFAVSRIEVVGKSGASSSCKQNIFVGTTAVSTETTGVTGSNTYEIASDYQAAGTQYTIKVTSAHNSQITAIKIYKAGGTVVETVAAPTFSPEGGIFAEAQDVEINCTTDGATIYYTIDGSAPTTSSSVYSSAISVEETTTIKAIAVKDGMNNSSVASATYTIKTVDPNWIDFTVQGFNNADDVETITGTNGSVTFAKANGSNAPKWYDSGSAVRIYAKNTITIAAEDGKKIESVEFSITSGSMSADGFDVDGTYASSIFTLAAPTNTIVYTTSANFRLDKIKINLSSDTREEAGLAFSAGEYTATLGGQNEFPTLSNPNGLTVSYESTNESVATVDAAGVVTINAAGETTITATSEETDDYLAGSASYTLTVTDPNAPGMSADNPYTVDQARAAIDAGTGVTGVYATGIVSEIVTAYNSQFGNITYNISADGSTTADQLQAYRGKSYNGDNFTSEDDIQVGDVVVIYGNLKKYNNTTYEFDANNQLVSLQREEVPSDKYYLAGSMTSWEDHKVEMTKKADGSYTLTGVEMAEGAEFKIIKMEIGATEPTWLGGQADGNQFWINVENHKNIPLVAGANFYMPIAGTWDITVSFDADNNPLITVDGSWPEVEYYLTGDFNTWTASDGNYKFTKQNDGTYKLTTNISGNFKVYDSLDHWYGATADGSYWITADNHTDIEMTDDAANYYLETANDYTFIVNPDTKKLTVTGWPIVLDGNAYVKITSTDELEDGYYLIVYEGDDDHASVAFNGGLEELDAANNGIEVKIAEKLIVANSTTNAAAFIIEKSSDSYTIKSSSNNYIGKTAYSNGLDASETTAYTNTIDFADGNAVITASGKCTLRYNYASDQARFRYYKSGQQPIALYKLTTVEEIPVTIGATGYATLYYSDKALAVPEGVTASTASVSDKNITLKDTEGFVPAGTGVVLNGEQGEYTFLVVPESTPKLIEGNMLSGSDEAATTTGGGKYYMLSLDKIGENVGFYYGAAKGGAFTNGAHKAYLVVPDATAGAKSFYLFSEAETTGIGSVQSTMFNDGRMEIFNLNGQRVSTPQRGIYIVNGKKVLVK